MNGFLQRNGFVLGGFTVVVLLILAFGLLFLGPAREATEDLSAQRALLASARDLIEDQLEVQRIQRDIARQQLQIQQDQRRFTRRMLALQRNLLTVNTSIRDNTNQTLQLMNDLLGLARGVSSDTDQLVGLSTEILDQVREINRKMPESTRPAP